MRYTNLNDFLTKGTQGIKGPVAVILCEDEVEIDTTVRHHIDLGFRKVICVASDEITIPKSVLDKVDIITFDMSQEAALEKVMNPLIAAFQGQWLFYCYNAEYLFFPFCEHRNVLELMLFNLEERREAILAYVVDLYAEDLNRHPSAVSLDTAMLDKTGYYGLARPDPANHNHPKERQLDFFGGLRWRFEEHIPASRRRIDRVPLFRANEGLKIHNDHRLSDEEMNTYACAWHNSITAAIASFRTAKALKRNPGSTYDIHTFKWHNSVRFSWHSQQLLDLGLMEPGQWF